MPISVRSLIINPQSTQAAAAVLARARRTTVAQECQQLRELKLWINGQRSQGQSEHSERIKLDLEESLNRRCDLLEERFVYSGKGTYGKVSGIGVCRLSSASTYSD